nr:retrovirus-related Pol polyprotein from transposon TNT 1-94 [Tanacetum cinerariifolium]
MTTLVEYIIVAGAKNHSLMVEKSMNDSWASHICLFIKGKKHGSMMLDLIDNGPLVYPTVKENGQTQLNKYSELTKEQKHQDDCDVQETNITFHGLPPDVYALGENPIDCIYKALALMSVVASGHMARQCTQPKRQRNSAWFKEKLTLVEAQEASQILDEEQLAFIADPGIKEALVPQQIIPLNAAF